MEKASGLDVHKDSTFAYVLDGEGNFFLERRYGTLTPELTTLRDALIGVGCERIAMESTSIYYMPGCLSIMCLKRILH